MKSSRQTMPDIYGDLKRARQQRSALLKQAFKVCVAAMQDPPSLLSEIGTLNNMQSHIQATIEAEKSGELEMTATEKISNRFDAVEARLQALERRHA